MEESKTCTKCGETKPFSEFHVKRSNLADGHRHHCKKCQTVIDVERRCKRPFETPIHNSRRRAKKAGVPFDLTEEYLESIWTGVCPVFGTRFDLPGIASRSPQTPSLDKIVPHKGYIQGNVIWISDLANRIKQEATSSQIQDVATWLRQTEEEIKKHATD